MRNVWEKGFTIALLLPALSFLMPSESNAYKILLMGDSTVICSSLTGADRIEAKLQAKLEAAYPTVTWDVANYALNGEYIGPGPNPGNGGTVPLISTTGPSRLNAVLALHVTAGSAVYGAADLILTRYGPNDGKNYSPDTFKANVANLCDLFIGANPSVVNVPEASVYSLTASYYISPSFVPGFVQGTARNLYLDPYYDGSRQVASERGYLCVDNYARMEYEVGQGNSDLWIDSVHVNAAGAEVIADEESVVLIPFLSFLTVDEGPLAAATLLAAYPHPSAGAVRIPVTDSVTWTGANAAARVYDGTGRLIREMTCSPAARQDGKGSYFSWDGRNDRGERVPAGVYFYRLLGNGVEAAAGRIVLSR